MSDRTRGSTRQCLLLAVAGLVSLHGCRTVPETTHSASRGYLIAPVSTLETPPEAELADIDELVERIVKKLEQDKRKTVRRDAHAKHHGCVGASVAISSQLPTRYRAGVFQPSACYRAVIRFSSSNAEVRHDAKADALGMAIKLLGVDGPKLLEKVTGWKETDWWKREKKTQDFLLTSAPTFFVEGVRDVLRLTRLNDERGILGSLFFFLTQPASLVRFIRSNQTFDSPLATTFRGSVPVRFGSDSAVMLSAFPVSCGDTDEIPDPKSSRDDSNYLRNTLMRQLYTGDHCFDLYGVVRKAGPETRRLVENATKAWKASDANGVRLARITIESQRLKPMDFCENVSMTPWHGTLAHQPLGGINRVRLPLYKAISERRHFRNKKQAFEPIGEGTCRATP